MESQFKKAKDAMTGKVIYIDGLATAKDAIDLMRREKTETLVVKKRGEGDAYGIVVLSDLIKGVIVPDRKFTEVSVYEVMTKPAISVPASMNIRYVSRLMMNIGVKTAPVEENGEYLGIISLHDTILDAENF
jgi:signal-transduction protein with cAMP-binding, CBS, and nucleotidyltransferase domain